MRVDEAMRLFNLEPGFTIEEVNYRWRMLAKKYHPDITKDKDDSYFKLLNEAYLTLKKTFHNRGVNQDSYDKWSREMYRRKKTNEKIKEEVQKREYKQKVFRYIYALFYLLIFNAVTGFMLLLIQNPHLYGYIYTFEIKVSYILSSICGLGIGIGWKLAQKKCDF